MRPPTTIVHADWSASPEKRWMARAEFRSGRYHIGAVAPVGPLGTFWKRLAQPGDFPCLVGFDFPIGLPAAYARRAGIADFREALVGFGSGRWRRFYDVAERPDEVDITRPFYPRRPGGTSRTQLVDGLGVEVFGDLLRHCDRPTERRRAGGALFWTMGAQQSGRGAIVGWRDLLAPAVADASFPIALWPFDGPLEALLERSAIVVAEAYPAEAAVQIGLAPPGRGWSKRKVQDRARVGRLMLRWASEHGVSLSQDTARRASSGFDAKGEGDDPFDALLGLLGMIAVALGVVPSTEPPDEMTRRAEGWLLGLRSPKG